MSDNEYAERKRADKVSRIMGCLAAMGLRTETELSVVHREWLAIVTLYLETDNASCQEAIARLESAAHLPHSMGRGSIELLKTTLAEALADPA